MTKESEYKPTEAPPTGTTLPEINLATCSNHEIATAQIIEAMKGAGACIVRNMFSRVTVDQVKTDIEPHISSSGNYGEKYDTTSVITALLSKSDEFALRMVGHEVFQKVVDHFLTTTLGPCSIAREVNASVTIKPQLDCTLAATLHPGGKPHALHRDDVDRLNVQPGIQEYQQGRDTNVTMLTAITPTTHANGATRVLPGSHLWDYSTLIPTPDDPSVVDAELGPGDSLFLLGCVLHGAGANSTNESRTIAACFAARGNLRQMENQFLAHDLDKVRQFPLWLKRFMGYSIAAPACGWLDKKDPLRTIDPDAGDFIDLYDPSQMSYSAK